MDEKTEKTKRQVDRSPAYPSIDLKSAVDLVAKIFDLFSDYGFTREVASEKLGLPVSSKSFRKIAALVQYGLLKRDGNSYKITPLSKEVVLATDEDERKKSLIKAVQYPKIFSTLLKENAGKGLPASLDTRLRQLDYSKDAAKGLAAIFKHSLEFSGLLNNGIVVDPSAESVETVDSNDGDVEHGLQMKVANNVGIKSSYKNEQPSNTSQTINSNEFISYPLDCGIIVMFPYSMVKKIVSGVFKDKLTDLELLGRSEENGKPASNVADTPVESN